MRTPLMPKATAVWLVDNTALTFEQIADFCDLHILEVKGIADGEVAQGIRGLDPITNGQITRQEIEKGESDPDHKLEISVSKVEIPQTGSRRTPRYTPLSRRQDRPNAILWLLRNHPELKDSQIIRLVGTTKPTIQAIRERTHWNSANLQSQDPIALALCSQTELDAEVGKAAQRVAKERELAGLDHESGDSLLPTNSTIFDNATTAMDNENKEEKELDADSVFSKLKSVNEDPEPDNDKI